MALFLLPSRSLPPYFPPPLSPQFPYPPHLLGRVGGDDNYDERLVVQINGVSLAHYMREIGVKVGGGKALDWRKKQ